MQLQKKIRAADIENYIAEVSVSSEALGKLYEAISPSVYAYALTVTRNANDAMDVLHDCVVKVYEKAPYYKANGKPMAWIISIAKNLCYDKFRRQSRFCDMTEEQLEGYFADNDAMSAEDRAVVRECLYRLDSDERTVVVLHAVSGLKHIEIAKLLQLPLSTVLSKYSRSIKKLKGTLSEV